MLQNLNLHLLDSLGIRIGQSISNNLINARIFYAAVRHRGIKLLESYVYNRNGEWSRRNAPSEKNLTSLHSPGSR